VASDIKLIFEAYKKVHEAAGETGAVVSPAASETPLTPKPSVSVAGINVGQGGSIKLDVKDAKRILKNLSDTYARAKDTASILQKNNVPDATKYLQAEKGKLQPFINDIINSTTGNPKEIRDMAIGLESDITALVNAAQSTNPSVAAGSPKGKGQTAQTGLPTAPAGAPGVSVPNVNAKAPSTAVANNAGAPIDTTKPGAAGVPRAVADDSSAVNTTAATNTATKGGSQSALSAPQPNTATKGGAQSAATKLASNGEPVTSAGVVGGVADTGPNSEIPTGQPVADDTVAPAPLATDEEPVRKAASAAPYYVMTTKGPRLATKDTPGAYQINRP